MMDMDKDLIAKAMREHRKREAKFLADTGTPKEICEAIDRYRSGAINQPEFVAVLEEVSEGNADLFASIKLNLGWAWCDDEVGWITSG